MSHSFPLCIHPGQSLSIGRDLRHFIELDRDDLKIEASRCLGCGATTVDFNKCIGCGLCTTRCEFDAIHLTRDLPHCSDMHTAEEMMSLVGPYALKRMVKIIKRKVTGKGEYPSEQ